MPVPDPTPIEKTEVERPGGKAVTRERHPSWVLVGISHVSASPGQRLFESEMQHSHFIRLSIHVAERERDLHRSWLSARGTIIEIDMSLAQWGAIVSSPNRGSGQPATLSRFHDNDLPQGMIPEAEWEPQLAHSHAEVRNAGKHALAEIRRAQEAVQEAFDQNLGKREMRSRLHHLKCMMDNGPGNMEFAAKSLTEHVENVVTKARGDVESMVQQAIATGQSLELEQGLADRLLGPAPTEADEEVVEVEGEEVVG